MNWDWEKLQEKRQRQGKTPQPQGDGPENPFGGFNFGKILSKILGGGIPVLPVLIIALAIWFASGIFIVNPGEVGVITFFGKYDREVGDGPHYRLPYPIESSIILNKQLLRTAEIGHSTESAKSSQGKAEDSSMFTGDENIVQMQFNVQYNINDAYQYLFKVKDPVLTISIAAEAAMREVVGSSHIDSILTSGRQEVQTKAKDILTTILRSYEMGVSVHAVQLLDVQPPPEVESAFRDVASAREDKDATIKRAEAYYMEIVPVANGTAISMLNAAKAYERNVTLAAEGEATRFLAMVSEFNKAPDLTRKRMYLEAMGDILASPSLDKVIVSKDAKINLLPMLNLDKTPQISNPQQAAPAGSPK